MCGRTTYFESHEEMMVFYDTHEPVPDLPKRWNVAPTTQILTIVRGDDGHRHGVTARWGLVPFWAKDIPRNLSTINARAETITEKPTWREPLKRGRCIIPMSGWYEWTEEQGGKQPWHFTRPDGQPLSFAGLWAWNEALQLRSCAIIVCEGNDVTGLYHDRMPVILERDQVDAWFDAPDLSLLAPYKGPINVAEANRAVGNVKNQGEWLLQPGASAPGALL
jgi:putative SOS response-associated peptidase YedK